MYVVFAVLVLVISALISKQLDSKNIQSQVEVLSEQTESPSPSPKQTQFPSSVPSNVSVIIKQEVRDNSQNIQSINLSDLKYPNSSQISTNVNTSVLESIDDPKTITDWYKEKIISLGYKSKSFVQTTTNGNVLNKLVGVSSGSEIRVDIEKKSTESKTRITIVITTT